MLFAGLGSTNKSATSLLFSSSLTLALSLLLCILLRLSFYLNLSSRSDRNCLLFPSVLLHYNGSAVTRFSRRTPQLMSWPDGERYSCPPQFLVVSLLSSLVSTLLSSWTGGVLFYLNSSTHRFSPISIEKLGFYPHARCVLFRLRCNGHSLLLISHLSRIGKIKNPCCSTCGHLLSHSAPSMQLRTLCAARSTTSGANPGELPGFWGSMVFRHAPFLGRGRVATITTTRSQYSHTNTFH